MQPMSSLEQTREYYAGFAEDYAKGESATYDDWARGVAADDELIARLGELEAPKRQPNLLFAAARWHGVPDRAPFAQMRQGVLDQWAAVSATMRSRSTQTNEVRRCASLVPLLGRVLVDVSYAPLALLEVGVSGGLCLYPDRYGYRYLDDRGEVVREIEADRSVVLESVVDGVPREQLPATLPRTLPEVHWRGGLDLNPLDITDEETLRWLRTLVWPEHEDRLALLDAAAELVGGEERTLVRGDARTDLSSLMARARSEAPQARLVVFHTAVAAYFEDDLREDWPDLMAQLCAEHDAVWISNEHPEVLPSVADAMCTDPPAGRFCLGVSGQGIAWTHGHGRSLTWDSGPCAAGTDDDEVVVGAPS
ncbi:DUF2332 domain-containing protein [Marihabitans asiaticum]|uniref:DUF2332 domain-containing protein n=1 Tax=Marihabitans asiaticum TaxID=415218 RepID=A0A560W6Y9_9MICO|nr:DUF2332 domain-containing protein [Marihabitans asiaticum]TWD13382.1 hypothetical protein FB557_2783 [Marihabitans asiaticum]